MDSEPSRYPVPCRRTMLASLDVRVFLKPWTLTLRCGCGRTRVASLPDLARIGMRDREVRLLGKLVGGHGTRLQPALGLCGRGACPRRDDKRMAGLDQPAVN